MACLAGFGKYVPGRIVTNEELGDLLRVSPEWIEQISGIKERRFSAANESVIDLAFLAAIDCLRRSGARVDEVRFLLVASGTSPRRFPGLAAPVAHRLGLNGIPALDVPMASAGSLFALCLAFRLAPDFGTVLIVAAEKLSQLIQRKRVDPGVAVLFGDGAGACLVKPQGKVKLLSFTLHSDGEFADDLFLDFQGRLRMDGRSIILQAGRKLPRAIQLVLERENIRPDSVGAFILHQGNQHLLDAVARSLGVPQSRFVSNLKSYGNTSSASMLIAAAEWDESAGFKAGVHTVFGGFGAGFHWGAIVAVGTQNANCAA